MASVLLIVTKLLIVLEKTQLESSLRSTLPVYSKVLVFLR